MTHIICPPDVFSHVIISVTKRAGEFHLSAIHAHEGHPHGLCPAEKYTLQQWAEVVDVTLVSLDQFRPGAVPAGWEQLELF